MQSFRPVSAHPLSFGRGRVWQIDQQTATATFASDIKLFAATFLAGFLFVSILIG